MKKSSWNFKDLTGKKFNRLTCLKLITTKPRTLFLWKCSCGKEKVADSYYVSSGKTKSCGCLNNEKRAKRIVAWSKKTYIEKGCLGKFRNDGYHFIKLDNHPLASKEGYVAEHRLIMEEKIGRFLKPGEVVHHWDDKTKINSKNNLCLFRSNSPHFRLHLFANRHKLPIEIFKFEQPWLCQ